MVICFTVLSNLYHPYIIIIHACIIYDSTVLNGIYWVYIGYIFLQVKVDKFID